MNNSCNRNGTSSIEFVVVASTIVAALVTVLIAFDATHPFTSVSSQLGSQSAVNGSMEPLTSGPANDYKVQVDLRLAISGLTVLVGFTYLLIRRTSNSSNADEPKLDELGKAELSITDAPQEAITATYKKRQAIRNIFRSHLAGMVRGETELLVGHLHLSTNIFSVPPQMTVADCSDLLHEKGYRRAMVVDKIGKLHGVVSKKDVATKSGELVCDVMSAEPKTVNSETPLQVAISVLMCHRISCLPIVEDEKLVGVLSMSDLIVALQVLLLSFSEKELVIDNVLAHR